MHTYIRTCDGKMADKEVARSIEEALNKIINTKFQSGNVRKEQKMSIYENLSTL